MVKSRLILLMIIGFSFTGIHKSQAEDTAWMNVLLLPEFKELGPQKCNQSEYSKSKQADALHELLDGIRKENPLLIAPLLAQSFASIQDAKLSIPKIGLFSSSKNKFAQEGLCIKGKENFKSSLQQLAFLPCKTSHTTSCVSQSGTNLENDIKNFENEAKAHSSLNHSKDLAYFAKEAASQLFPEGQLNLKADSIRNTLSCYLGSLKEREQFEFLKKLMELRPGAFRVPGIHDVAHFYPALKALAAGTPLNQDLLLDTLNLKGPSFYENLMILSQLQTLKRESVLSSGIQQLLHLHNEDEATAILNSLENFVGEKFVAQIFKESMKSKDPTVLDYFRRNYFDKSKQELLQELKARRETQKVAIFKDYLWKDPETKSRVTLTAEEIQNRVNRIPVARDKIKASEQGERLESKREEAEFGKAKIAFEDKQPTHYFRRLLIEYDTAIRAMDEGYQPGERVFNRLYEEKNPKLPGTELNRQELIQKIWGLKEEQLIGDRRIHELRKSAVRNRAEYLDIMYMHAESLAKDPTVKPGEETLLRLRQVGENPTGLTLIDTVAPVVQEKPNPKYKKDQPLIISEDANGDSAEGIRKMIRKTWDEDQKIKTFKDLQLDLLQTETRPVLLFEPSKKLKNGFHEKAARRTEHLPLHSIPEEPEDTDSKEPNSPTPVFH